MREPISTRITRHFLPSEATVLGVRLGEFTLWHWARLAAYELPAGNLDYSGEFHEFAEAVRICAVPPNSDLRLKLNWRDRIKWKFKTHVYEPRLIDEEIVFMEWIDYHLAGPARWNREGSSKVKCPGWLYLVTRLVNIGFPPVEAWACTPGRARCFIAADDVYRGGGDFVEDAEIDVLLNEGGYTEEDLGLG